jgi:hypothetical protein
MLSSKYPQIHRFKKVYTEKKFKMKPILQIREEIEDCEIKAQCENLGIQEATIVADMCSCNLGFIESTNNKCLLPVNLGRDCEDDKYVPGNAYCNRASEQEDASLVCQCKLTVSNAAGTDCLPVHSELGQACQEV